MSMKWTARPDVGSPGWSNDSNLASESMPLGSISNGIAPCFSSIWDMTAEALCEAPQRKLIKVMLDELKGMLGEFEDAYFHEV